MFKVTIQATPIGVTDWKVVATGTWTPGLAPELDNNLLPEVTRELFQVTPAATDKSGRNQIESGDKLYAVVYRNLARVARGA